jgi:hypothetical protein
MRRNFAAAEKTMNERIRRYLFADGADAPVLIGVPMRCGMEGFFDAL